jgi:hypothetical protein
MRASTFPAAVHSDTSTQVQTAGRRLSPDEPRFWREAASELESRQWSTQLDAFAQVHQMLMKGLAPEKTAEYAHWGDELQHAKSGTEQAFSDSGKKQRFMQQTKDMVAALNAQKSEQATSAIFYGGGTGDEIFKTMNSTYVVPTLHAFMDKLSAEIAGKPIWEQVACVEPFLDCLLDLAGKGRNTIAQLTATNNVEEFGKRRAASEGTRMIDTCDASVYKPWKANITNRVSSLVASIPEVEKWRANGGSLVDFVDARGTLSSGARVVRFNVAGEGGGPGHTIELSVDHSQQPAKCCGTLYGLPYDASVARYEFEWAERKDGVMALDQLFCHHAFLDDNTVSKGAAEEFARIARWQPGDATSGLVDDIASFIYKLSHSSTYFRGQAAAMEKIIEAVLRSKGMQIEIGPDFLKPNPTYDQQALATFDRQEFIQKARQSISVKPLAS